MKAPPRPNRRFQTWKITGLLTLFLLTSNGMEVFAADPQPRPNVIIVMADDMGLGDTSAYQDFTGNTNAQQLHTPAMERLARTGIRFTDAHTPGSRCTPTRYSLLTGRYPWRSRLKWWVLFGAQGDPLIEPDRITLPASLQSAGYRTAIVGKWHVGLRYRQHDGTPAAGWNDADLLKPLHSSPLDYGFDEARITSRSHATSGPDPTKPRQRNTPNQKIGPGHIHGRTAIGATPNGRQLAASGPKAYILNRLGSRHSDHVMTFLNQSVTLPSARNKPFFLYYPLNANHSPYTPDQSIGEEAVKGAARNKDGTPMGARHEFIYENDVALGRILNWLSHTPDPRNPGHRLQENTLIIFTSDNGAEITSKSATGPFRSNKGSCYEGGHRVPFIARWPAGGVGRIGNQERGQSSAAPIGLNDLFATIADASHIELPSLRRGEKGAEDSISFLRALRQQTFHRPQPLMFADHKESKSDPAVLALRMDNPSFNGTIYPGLWKIFFDASLIRFGTSTPFELYNLQTDPQERKNLIDDPNLKPLIQELSRLAEQQRKQGGQRFPSPEPTHTFRWTSPEGQIPNHSILRTEQSVISHTFPNSDLTMTLQLASNHGNGKALTFHLDSRGLGTSQGSGQRFEAEATLLVRFNQPVYVQSLGIQAGDGRCGGSYQVGNTAPLPLYCTDSDNDSKEQHGLVSDIGVLPAGEPLRLTPAPYLGVETAGSWHLTQIDVRELRDL